MKYTMVPDWLKNQKPDPFDYPLRSKQEVMEEQKYFVPDFEWRLNFNKFPSDDQRENQPTRVDFRDTCAKVYFDFRDLGLSP